MNMRKELLILPVLIVFLWLTSGCSKNEFDVEVNLTADVAATYKIVYYASDKRGGLTVESALVLTAGKGKLKGMTRNPTIVMIYKGGGMLPLNLFYVRRGDNIEIKGDSPSPEEWNIMGNKVNEQLDAWMRGNGKIVAEAATALTTRIEKEGKDEDADRNSEAKLLKLNQAVAKYVKADSSRKSAAILLMTYYIASIDPEEYARLYALIESAGGFDNLEDLIVRQDSPLFDKGGNEKILKGEDIIVQSYSNNNDTLRIASGKRPGILLFRDREMDDEKKEVIKDSLKKLIRLRSDSSSAIIADICLTRDSTAWAYDVNHDSLQTMVRAIALRGMADPIVTRFRVRETPWWVVSDPAGRIVYGGPKINEAMKEFRKLLIKKNQKKKNRKCSQKSIQPPYMV